MCVFGLLWAGFLVIGLGMIRGASSVEGYLALIKSRDVLRSTVTHLENENNNLREEILKLRESPYYARKILRDKYHIVENGEDIVFFAD